jgi:protein ImuB
MFAAVWLPNFRLQAALRWREGEGPCALVDGDATKGVILEANVAAGASWVEPGLTSAQALARCPELRIVLRSPAQERACQALLVELALEFSPLVEATADGLCTLDLTGAPRGACWQRLGADLVARCAEEGVEARVGVALHPDHAWLAACRAAPVNVVYDGASFCAALPMSVLQPSAELAAVLTDWGIRRVGEFLELPAQAVVERLGEEAGRLRRRVSGRSRRVLRLVRPTERYAEAFDFEYGIETTEPLLFLLRRFVDALAGRLRAGHRVAEGLALALPMEDGANYERTFSIPSPTADAEVWFRILSTHLESLTLDRQPVGVRLEVCAANPAGRQLNLFESALRDPNRFGETLAQLKALVGEEGVGVPQPADTHEPGAFRVEEFSEEEDRSSKTYGTYGLPLRRDRTGRAIAMQLMHEHPAWLEKHGPVLRAAGPYRTSGGWWERAWWIEEWDVEVENGCLRVSRGADGRWRLEGGYEIR